MPQLKNLYNSEKSLPYILRKFLTFPKIKLGSSMVSKYLCLTVLDSLLSTMVPKIPFFFFCQVVKMVWHTERIDKIAFLALCVKALSGHSSKVYGDVFAE